jgi:hypothetical protein
MKRKVALCFAVIALAVASAKSYNVTLAEKAETGNTELKPGDYKVEVKGDKAFLTSGKINAESPVKVETADRKYDSTSVKYSTADGKMRIQEIHLGGTRTKLVFTGTAP